MFDVYMLSQSRDQRTMSDVEHKLVLSYACKHPWRRVCLNWTVYIPLGGHPFGVKALGW